MQIGLTGSFVAVYLASAYAFLFVGGLSGFWSLAEGDVPGKYLFVVAAVGVALLPLGVILAARARKRVTANSALQPTPTRAA